MRVLENPSRARPPPQKGWDTLVQYPSMTANKTLVSKAVSEGRRAQATRLERNDGSTVTASGLGLNSHTPPSAVHTARCVPRRIACRTYRRMRERWCLAHIRRPPGQLEAPTSSCQLRIANVTWSTLLKSHRAARQLLAQHEAGGRYLPSSISTMPIRAAH